jgi:predicted nucleic acid-binding protein
VIVVDCAAVVDALTAPTGTEELRQRLAREELHAPALVDFEFVSALRGLTLAGRLSAARAQDALTDFEDLPLHRWEAGDALRRRAYALRDSLSAYDAAYVALAEALECELVTRDARLARSGGHAARITVH